MLNSKNSGLTLHFFKGIAYNMFKTSSCLRVLHISALNIHTKSWMNLSKAFKSPGCKIQTFRVNCCWDLTTEDIQIMLSGLWKNQYLQTLDLSHNMLEDDEKTANAICRLIVNQGEMRDMMQFFKNLRLPANSEKVSDSVGLKTIELSYNKFSSNFILEVCQVLQFDQYIRTIDLCYN